MRLVLATSNKAKVKEVKEILDDFEIVSSADLNIFDKIEETGKNFKENAIIKAHYVAQKTNCITIADDSGLCVDYLDGAPGIYSARFAGDDATDEQRNDKLLSLLKDVPLKNRTARYVCAIAIVYPNGKTYTFEDTCEGYILASRIGQNGFGYDPLFYYKDFDTTLANVSCEMKNKVSHRYKALLKLKTFLKSK